eukprot:EG_transcript_14230
MPVFSGGAPGFADGPAAQARFRYPIGGVLDSEGNLFVADTGNFRIRKLSPDGDVTTIAGSGLVGCADGPALEAQFRFPSCLCVDWQQPGALIITDYMSHCLRLLSPSGTISTLAGGPGEGGYCDGLVLKARFMNPACPQLGPAGDLFVVDRGNHCIRRIDRDRTTVTTFAGSRRPGFKDGLATEAEFRSPSGLAVGADGTLWLSDTKNHAIRRVAPDGTVTTIAGNGTAGLADGHGAAARFDSPMPVTLDGNGNLVVADKNNCIRLVTPAGCVTTILAPASATQTLGCPHTCPCFPTGLALTEFSELLFSGGNQIFTIPIGLPPYRHPTAPDPPHGQNPCPQCHTATHICNRVALPACKLRWIAFCRALPLASNICE